MATAKAAPKLNFDPLGELEEVEKIAAQLEAAAGVNRETRQRSAMWRKMADTINEAITATEGPYADLKDLQTVAPDLAKATEAIEKVSAMLNPVAEHQWTDEHLSTIRTGVEFFLTRGVYEGDEVARAETALRNLDSYRKRRGGSGDRSPRGSSQPIEGRPPKVLVVDTEGGRITEQTGNTENSVSNVTNSLRKYVEGKGVTLTDDQHKAIREAVRTCIEDGKSPVLVGDFATISHLA